MTTASPKTNTSAAQTQKIISRRPEALTRRPRRNRKSPAVRAMVRETRLHPSDFVAPYFVIEGNNQRQALTSMPGLERLSADLLVREAEELCRLGIPAMALFPVVPSERKDAEGSEALREDSLLLETVRLIKKEVPDICIVTDIALDPYTSHGHDGLLSNDGVILNDETVQVLGAMACLQAHAGVDIVAPSDMMDGRVGHIRACLDSINKCDVSILAYSTKYASAFYGPFRDALGSHPPQGDKLSYQQDPANAREALLEAELDVAEGADILMVKPGLPYLDIIAMLHENFPLPIAAYHVSGEYSMIKAAAENGWLDGPKAMHESLLSIKRAGASIIFTYAAKEIAQKL